MLKTWNAHTDNAPLTIWFRFRNYGSWDAVAVKCENRNHAAAVLRRFRRERAWWQQYPNYCDAGSRPFVEKYGAEEQWRVVGSRNSLRQIARRHCTVYINETNFAVQLPPATMKRTNRHGDKRNLMIGHYSWQCNT